LGTAFGKTKIALDSVVIYLLGLRFSEDHGQNSQKYCSCVVKCGEVNRNLVFFLHVSLFELFEGLVQLIYVFYFY
jgi:hypothetical protein